MGKRICNDKSGSDKKRHVICEFIIAVVIGVAASFIHFPSAYISAAIAFVGALLFGIWKEVKDSKQKGNHFCVWDLAWDVAGCLAGVIIALLASHNTWHDIAGDIIK